MKRLAAFCLFASAAGAAAVLISRNPGQDEPVPGQAIVAIAGAGAESREEAPALDSMSGPVEAKSPSPSLSPASPSECSVPAKEIQASGDDRPARKVVLTGTVRDGRGDNAPIEGAAVVLWLLRDDSSSEAHGDAVLRTATGPDGRFIFNTVAVGEFMKLRVEAAGHARWSCGIIVEEEGTNLCWKGGYVLEATLAGEASIKVSLDPAGTAAGLVTDPFGQPVPRAKVHAVLPESNDACFFGFHSILDQVEEIRQYGERAESFTAVADDLGRYSMTGLPAGWNCYLFCAFDEQGHFGVVESVKFPEDKLDLSQDIQIKTFSSLQVAVIDPDGCPLPGVDVNVERDCNLDEAVDIDIANIFANSTRRVTDSQGRFEIPSLHACRYIVSAWPLDSCPAAQSVEVLDNQVSCVTIATRRGGTIAGFVARDIGPPLESGRVSVNAGEIVFPDGSSKRFEWTGVLGRDGSFRRGGIPEGSVFVRAVSPGTCEEVIETHAGSIDLRITLKPHPVFQGIIDFPSAGRETCESMISFDNCWQSGTVLIVDASGRFSQSWSDWRRDRKACLVLNISDWLPIVLGPYVPNPGEVIDLGTIRKPLERSLGGVVRNPSGAPCKGAAVAFEHASIKDFKVFGITGEDGKFLLDRIPLAEGSIRAESEGFPPAEAAIGKEGAGPVVLKFHPPAYIRGRVVDRAGIPKQGQEISIYRLVGEEWIDCDRTGLWDLKSDCNGCYTSMPLNSGRYIVQKKYYYPKQGPRGRREINLAEGETALVEIEVP